MILIEINKIRGVSVTREIIASIVWSPSEVGAAAS